MNQILSVEMDNKKGNNKGPANIKSVVKFFAIALIIFAIFLLIMGIYTIYKNNSNGKGEKSGPQISLENKTENILILKINHTKAIKKITYCWNEEEKQEIEGNNKKYIEEQIEIPSGTNTLTVTATDSNNQTTTSKKQFELGSTDIKVESSGANVKIKINSKKTISYVTYRWDEEQENKIDVNDNKFEKEIETIKGTHTLTVIAVDNENETEKLTKTIKGVTKPKIAVTLEGDKYYVIKVTDEEALSKIEFISEGEETITEEITDKEFEYKIPLKKGSENNLTINAYNSNNIEAKKKVKCKIEQ